MDHGLKCKTKNLKLIQEGIVANIHDIRLSSGFIDMTPKAQITKEKEMFAFIILKNFCASVHTIKKVKRQPRGGEKSLQVMYLIKNMYLKYIKISYS